jgi:hypothetical protein
MVLKHLKRMPSLVFENEISTLFPYNSEGLRYLNAFSIKEMKRSGAT